MGGDRPPRGSTANPNVNLPRWFPAIYTQNGPTRGGVGGENLPPSSMIHAGAAVGNLRA
jgi:hypothetical protein